METNYQSTLKKLYLVSHDFRYQHRHVYPTKDKLGYKIIIVMRLSIYFIKQKILKFIYDVYLDMQAIHTIHYFSEPIFHIILTHSH